MNIFEVISSILKIARMLKKNIIGQQPDIKMGNNINIYETKQGDLILYDLSNLLIITGENIYFCGHFSFFNHNFSDLTEFICDYEN